MPPSPPSAPTSDRLPAVTTEDVTDVRPLPPTEPGPGRPPESVPPADRRTAAGALADPAVPVPARRAAHALILIALEVVDRKRAAHHTRGAFPDHLTEMLRALARDGVPGQHLGPARIHRLHIHPAGAPSPADGPTGPASEVAEYEVCATYARGPRLFAVAARIRVGRSGASCTALRLV